MGALDWRPFIYGGLASCTAEFGTFPIDTTKTRLQIQGQKCDRKYSEVRYRGMVHAIWRICREEGVRALYYGISPAVLRQATYGTIKFGLYYSLKSAVVQYTEDETLFANACCGVFAGAVSSAIANPTDVVKVRMQARNEQFRQKRLLQAFLDVYKLEGLPGLWRGVGPTAQRAAVVVGVELPLYDFFKRSFINRNILGDTPVNHFLSSFISSLGGAIASTPLDVIKTRLMNQRKLKATVLLTAEAQFLYQGSLDCLVQTVKHEGPLAMYRGFIPNWLRLGPWNIIFFITYEQLKTFY